MNSWQKSIWVFLSLLGFHLIDLPMSRGESGPVFVIPVREDVDSPLAYLIRRGVKEAMAANAEVLILDMETNGGRVDVTEEIIQILNQFKGRTITFVNRKAFSAGAFIAVATSQIYMAPQSVIGAATPIMIAPGGGVEKLPDSVEAKMTSGISAMIRATAEKNGHNTEVVEAMIDRNKEFILDGVTINEKGRILTLTNLEAEKSYGNPLKPLLSLGTMPTLEALLKHLGLNSAQVTHVKPTGAETIASWLAKISPFLLIAGILGVYLEFKTPGFGAPGIVGVCAFALYFLGGYVAGLSGLEWIIFFLLGLTIFGLEVFLFPGTVFLAVVGGALMFLSLLMGWVDYYPGMPRIPNVVQLRLPLFNLTVGFTLAGILAFFLSRYFPKSRLYRQMVSTATSGNCSVTRIGGHQLIEQGLEGLTMSDLRPGGRAQFGDQLMDVLTQGELISKGVRVRVLHHSNGRPVVVEA